MVSGFNRGIPSSPSGNPGSGGSSAAGNPSSWRRHLNLGNIFKAAVLLAVAVDSGKNYNNYINEHPNDPAFVTGVTVAADDVMDVGHGIGSLLGWFAEVTKPAQHLIPTYHEATATALVCVPPSLAHEGWDDPIDPTVIAYKHDTESWILDNAHNLYLKRERDPEKGKWLPPLRFTITDQLEAFDPDLTGRAAALQVRDMHLVNDEMLKFGEGASCPVGDNSYEVSLNYIPHITPKMH